MMFEVKQIPERNEKHNGPGIDNLTSDVMILGLLEQMTRIFNIL